MGENVNSEFTGIRFENTNIEAGLITVETNRPHDNSVMRFYTRVSNNIISPLEIRENIIANNSIVCNAPIIKNAWSSGELIKTTVYNQTNSASGVQTISNTGNFTDWKTFTYTTLNDPSDSIIIIEVFAPYINEGLGSDTILSKITDTTTTQIIVESGAKFFDGFGGGGRGLSFLPINGSYTPTNTTKTRTIKIQFDNASNDPLYICSINTRSGIQAKNYYTIKVSEYKI